MSLPPPPRPPRPPRPFTYDSLESLAVMVKVTPNDTGSFDAEIQREPGKENIVGAIAAYMALPDKSTLSRTPIIMGGSSKGGKSRRNRKSKKARKGKSLRRK